MLKILGVASLILFLPSCHIPKKEAQKMAMEESIARLSMIPDVPFGIEVLDVIKSKSNPNAVQVICKYTISQSIEDLKSFYLQEMERLGWKLQAEYEGNEIILLFVKAEVYSCMISIRKKQEFVITLLVKKEVP